MLYMVNDVLDTPR